MREAPSIDLIEKLQKERVRIRAYDPQAMENAKGILNDMIYCRSLYELAGECDALAIVTEWDEFRELDLLMIKRLLRQPVIIDGRNIFDPLQMKNLGFTYEGVGR
jgi:UDPglucose 6-dehydrogenase